MAKKTLTRRDFMLLGGTAIAAGAGVLLFKNKLFGPAAPPTDAPTPTPTPTGLGTARVVPQKRGVVIGPGRYHDETGAEIRFLTIIDLDADEPKPKRIQLDFHAHGVSPHPIHPTKAALFEKQGAGACWVDLTTGRVLQPITTPAERYFYGHGAWTHDGEHVFATESVLATKAGKMIVRDRNFEIRDIFPTYGASPHDCVLIDNGNTLVITNGGSAFSATDELPSVTFVDVKSQKLIEKLEFDTPRINAGHLAVSETGDLVVVSAPRMGLAEAEPGGVSMRSGKNPLKTMSEPLALTSRLFGEALSVCIHEPIGIVGITHPKGLRHSADAGCVTFWDIKRQRHVKTLELPHPMGIGLTLDEVHFLISYGPKGSLRSLRAETLEPTAEVEWGYLSGSHFILHDFGTA